MTRAAGWYLDRTKVRYVHVPLGGGKRKSVRLLSTTDEEADARASVVREVARALLVAGRGDQIVKWTALVVEGDDATAKKFQAWARDLATGKRTLAASAKTNGANTFRDVLNQWTTGELARVYPDDVKPKRSWRDDEYRAGHIADEYLDTPVAAWSTDTYKRVMAALPGSLGQTTRRHVAQVMHRVFELAKHPLDLIATNPIPRMPMKGKGKLQATLLPRHLVKIGACRKIDLGRRLLWLFLGSESGWRPSQAVGRQEPKRKNREDESVPPLFWANVNFERAVAFLQRTKTTAAVEVELDDATVTALERWKAISPRTAPSDPVFVTTDGKPIENVRFADMFREDLAAAGITRETDPELFPEGSELAHREPACPYDLRALFVTASLAQGKTPDFIMRHTLHVTLSMLETYRRRATHFAKHGPLTPAIVAIPELAGVGEVSDDHHGGSRSGGNGIASTDETSAIVAEAARSQATQRILDPLIGVRIPAPEQRVTETEPVRPTLVRQDPVEIALAKALEGAAAAQRWDVVAQLAKELEAIRLARAENVVPIDARRTRR